jgi:hypothetical protein
MNCKDTAECFEQISTYFSGERTGYALIVNTENYHVYQDIFQRLQADSSKHCIYISDMCQKNGLPDVDGGLVKITVDGVFALVGLSQAMMLQSEDSLEIKVDEALGSSISGYAVILMDHCKKYIQKFMRRDPRIQNRVILVDGESSALPQIRITKMADECFGFKPFANFGKFLACLECQPEDQTKSNPVITVITDLNPALFTHAIYSISQVEGVYDALTARYSDLGGTTFKSYGTDKQWKWLASQMKSKSSFSELICDVFGATVNLSAHLSDITDAAATNRMWLLWLAMKVFGEKNNEYLSLVLNHSETVDDFTAHIYLDLVDIDRKQANFNSLYIERKRIIEQLPENLPFVAKYCERLGKFEQNELFYLTDSSDNEKYEFVRCLSVYDYSEAEIKQAVTVMSKPLSLYMQPFTFDSVNTKLGDEEFRGNLTAYFQSYKKQKLTNRIYPKFLEKVTEYASSRPYNKLSPRSSIIAQMNKKNLQLYFFDALGIEYLSFILAKCEEYGLVSEVSIGHGELPSITAKNKEFLQYFDENNCRKIDALDEMKHHSQVFNYEKCTYPLHLFSELDVIDEALRQIQSQLIQGTIEKAVIVSDHGASRLAVLYGHENQSSIQLDESAEHSGRCCPVEEDPRIPFAAYEDGFAVLANYDRFKGGRKANVEVHGGASLEEVIVPVITLTKQPENIEICFTDPVVILRPREQATITLYSNIPLTKPRLLINGTFYDGEFVADKKHARFVMPQIKRTRDYSAEVFDGEKNMAITLVFSLQKPTREVDLL